MKNKGFVLLVIFVVGIAAILYLTTKGEPPKKQAAKGLEAPAFELKDIEGKTRRLSDLKGKTILIHFWASWCDTCRMENPSIQSFLDAQKGNNNFVFVSVLYRDNPSNVIEYMKANGFNFPVLVDDKDISHEYGITGVPETFIINKKGIIIEKIIGPINWGAPDVRAALMKLINDNS